MLGEISKTNNGQQPFTPTKEGEQVLLTEPQLIGAA